MIKQCILSTIAAVLSLFIILGGWYLTNELLNRQHLSLLNEVHSISTNETLEDEGTNRPNEVILSTQEMADILFKRHSSRLQNYHDPYNGQLSMEQAMEAAYSELSHFCDKGVLPQEILEVDFTVTNAFLYDVLSVAESKNQPNPAYSFWMVGLSNREVSVSLTLNALTGQIWMADISSYSPTVNFDGIKALNVLKQFEEYLDLSGGSELRSHESFAYKSYDDNLIGISVYKKVSESGHSQFLNFSLTVNNVLLPVEEPVQIPKK